LGKLLDREQATCCLDDLGRSERRARCVQLAVLHFAAAEARNKSAADALKVYYGLAEVESGLDAVEAALVEIDDVQAKIDELKSQDLTVPFDASQFARQRLTLIAKRADLEANRATLNAKLRTLLGFDAPPEAPLLWPDEGLRLTDLALDTESEVAYGLSAKPELAALHRLATVNEQDTAAAAKALLGDVHGLMGVAARSMVREMLNSMLGVNGPEACVRRSQIRALYEGRAKQLSADVRAAVETIDARRRQAVAAQRQVESRRKRIDELTQRHETGQASFVELSEARLQLIDERQAVTSAVIAWKRAVVELRELQGALVAECRGGVGPTSPVVAEEPVPVPIEPLPAVDM
jgi:outer membrane protein TolC